MNLLAHMVSNLGGTVVGIAVCWPVARIVLKRAARDAVDAAVADIRRAAHDGALKVADDTKPTK